MNPVHSAPQIKLPPYALQMFVIVGLPDDSRKAFYFAGVLYSFIHLFIRLFIPDR